MFDVVRHGVFAYDRWFLQVLVTTFDGRKTFKPNHSSEISNILITITSFQQTFLHSFQANYKTISDFKIDQVFELFFFILQLIIDRLLW